MDSEISILQYKESIPPVKVKDITIAKKVGGGITNDGLKEKVAS